jgi:molecular chaperone GrpE
MRTWYESEELVERFRQWLGRTEQEIQATSEGEWDDDDAAADDDSAEVGLLQLVEAFTALRHELKLQTKSTRGLDDSVQRALAGLDDAAEQLRGVEAREGDAVERAAWPLVEALVELDEALYRGVQATEAAQSRVVEDAVNRFEQAARDRLNGWSWWRRRRARTGLGLATDLFRVQVADLQRRVLQPLLEGYRLICERLERTLPQLQIERIECVGQAVDPARMIVVEVVDLPDVEGEIVVDQVRPGYEWRGQRIRCAEVRAARGR